MFEIKSKKRAVIFIVAIIVFLIGVFGAEKYSQAREYKNLVNVATKNMEEKDYDKALEEFKKALECKEGEAINESINQCKTQLISLAEAEIEKKNYEEANKNIDILLKHDSDNKEGKEIKLLIEGKEGQEKEITKEEAEKLLLSIKEKEEEVKYLGIAKVPTYPLEVSSYEKFPEEIIEKEVHIFERIMKCGENSGFSRGRFYVDFNGNIYKDTYHANLECVKVK
ncbi:MAG: tetratricopeptide repeat protein [Clostridiaceae bacterium]